ncbi:MAG: hypothetical protein GWN58_27805 [Anaerolineae bacterium]|nr:hypothetical protein [Anaerolineae bacterium]
MSAPFRVLSWGCGLQSTLLGELSARGELPHLDLIITADTGWERPATYEARDFYTARWREMGMQVEIISVGNIQEIGMQEHIHIPMWTSDGGPLRRQCTRFFKIRPVKRRIRELLGYDRSKPPHPPPGSVELWMGITLDEWTRAKPSQVAFITHRWPLLELRMSRTACLDKFDELGLPAPPKSACVCCPYRRASEWIDIRETEPEEWAKALEFDEHNRNNPLAERDSHGHGSTADALYLWRECVPLVEADLEFEAAKEKRVNAVQMPLFACESGFCGT